MSKNDTPILDTSKSHMSFFDISRTASTFLQTIVNISREKRDNDKKNFLKIFFFIVCTEKLSRINFMKWYVSYTLLQNSGP